MTQDKNAASITFGQTLREKRLAKNFTLRQFAGLVGVSPTYLSQVEQCNVAAPTAERVRRIAELLEEDTDEWAALADRVPEDLIAIILRHPKEIPALLRELNTLSSGQLRHLQDYVKTMKSATD